MSEATLWGSPKDSSTSHHGILQRVYPTIIQKQSFRETPLKTSTLSNEFTQFLYILLKNQKCLPQIEEEQELPQSIRKKMIPSLNCGVKRGSMILNDDVIREILSRLPSKCLLKFKSVCKWWYYLISDPIFISNYSRRNPHYHVSGLFLQKFSYLQLYSDLEFIPFGGQIDATPEPSLSFIEDDSGVCIQHSCNGLLICSSFRCHETDRKYYICKPTTKQYFALPSPECKYVFSINIAFEPENLPNYKVICICDSKLSSHHLQIKIFNPDTKSWRFSGKPFSAPDELLFKRGVYWRGALNWVGRGELSLRFDIQRELLHKIPMPHIHEGREERRRLIYFGESGGHLYLIQFDPQTTIFEVLEMKRDYSGWFVKYHVDLDAIAVDYPEMVRRDVSIIHRFVFSVLQLVHKGGEEKEEESFMILHIPGKFILYDFRSNRVMEFGDVPPNLKKLDRHMGLKYTWEEAFPYTNTLSYL